MTDTTDDSGRTSITKKDSAPWIDECETQPVSRRLWLASAAAILIVGALLRLFDLNLVPLHHDEGVNGNFLLQLVRKGFYQYDPQNYHGPTLYYLAALVPWISRLFGRTFQEAYGLTTFTIRLVPAVFGVATIWLLLTLRRRIGSIAALTSAALFTISPGAVYLSRYFIHEPLLVFFTLGLVVAALRFYESGRPAYLLIAAASAAMMFATKETAIITVGVLLIALASTTVFAWLREPSPNKSKAAKSPGMLATLRERWRLTAARFGGLSSLTIFSIAALSLFLTIELLFYSSFFTNYPKGLYDAVKTFDFWAKTAAARNHSHPWWTYFGWILKEESPLVLLGAVGVVLAIWRGSNRFAVFTALWTVGTIAAYSLIPYKTPWLMLNFILPLVIMGGNAVEEIYKWARPGRQRLVALLIGVALLGVSAYQMLNLNFVHYDDEEYVYVYVHTQRQILPMLNEIRGAATRAGTGTQTVISIVSPEYWPLPWYLRYYPYVRYGGVNVTDDPIIIASRQQQEYLLTLVEGRYDQVKSNLNPAGSYPLRPGVELVLFVRRDLHVP